MAKYVNVDNFCKELNTFCDAYGFDWYVPKYDLVRVMEKHVVEAEPIRYGKWIIEEYTNSIDGSVYKKYKCSECGCPTAMFIRMPYCSNCGAKMGE